MGILHTFNFILNHPLNKGRKVNALMKFVKWQVNTKLNPNPVLYSFTDRSKLIIRKGMSGATGNIYCGLHEFNDMSFLLHFLREKDLFVDIGANVGSYTVLSSAQVGANTISIEPVPSTYNDLINNISVNRISDKVEALNIALGSKKGSIAFTSSLDTVNHVAVPTDTNTINVKVETLDGILAGKEVPALLKIDVEGFETEVINGASNLLKEGGLKAIIIELNGSGDRYGYDEAQLHQVLLSNGFSSYSYEPFKRELKLINVHGGHNTIYIKDLPFVQDRLKTAAKIKVSGKEF